MDGYIPVPPGPAPLPLISTKLSRPRVAADAVRRDRLCAALDEGFHLPLRLLSAPAGYGKTTLVCHWLDTRAEPSAWLALDETDNDAGVFFSYLVAAVRGLFPEACAETRAILGAAELPPIPILLTSLANGLEEVEDDFVLVLDDYQHVREPAIHQVLSGLLEHPPRALHLVILSRRDPALPIGSLRGRHLMSEIRIDALAFTRHETGAFVRRATGRDLDEAAVDRLHAGTEGWPVALRLAALALRHREDVDTWVQGFDGGAQMQRYLLDEVLSLQHPATAKCLCETSILDRFSAGLVDAVCSRESGIDGRNLIAVLEDTGFPSVALDDRRVWYRHHHLLLDLLRRRLHETHEPAAIAGLHRRAAAWFEENALLEEALEHAVQSGDAVEAGRLVARHGRGIKDGEQWLRLLKLLAQLPTDVVETDVDLLLLKAWSLDNRLLRAEAWTVLDRIEALMSQGAAGSAEAVRARAEIDVLRSCQRLEEARCDLAIDHADRALASLPPDCQSERGYATISLVLSHQACGRIQRSFEIVYDALESSSGGTYRARLMSSLAWIQWLEADLRPIKTAAREYASQGRARGLAQSTAAGQLFLGAAEYQLNELDAAEQALTPLLSDRLLVATSQLFVQGGFALASVFQATGRPDEASETAARVEQGTLRIQNAEFLQHARAFRAELALRQGRVAEAVCWAEQYDPEPFRLIYRFYAPEVTAAKALIAEGSTENVRRAEQYLGRLEAFLSRTHNKIFLIPVLALGALWRWRQGDEAGALARLGRAVALAQPGGAIRVFADLDPEIGRLLNRLTLNEEGLEYVGRVLAAFRTDEAPTLASVDRRNTVDPLSARELEVLDLLARRLSNKEIAERLHVSAGTVKRHTENIYQKLGVHGRRDAAAKASGLGLLRATD